MTRFRFGGLVLREELVVCLRVSCGFPGGGFDLVAWGALMCVRDFLHGQQVFFLGPRGRGGD